MLKKVIKKTLKALVIVMYNIMYSILPLDERVILFESSVGRNYTGNPKAVYECMVQQHLDKKYKCIWILENTHQDISGKCIKVKRLRIKYFYYMAIAKFWVMDSRQPSYLKKKNGNIYIQTWHGTPLKKLGLDMDFVNMGGHKNIEEYRNTFKNNSKRWDYLISQNNYSSEIFRHAFSFNKEILEIGYPRNDLLFNNNKHIHQLKKNLNIDDSKKVILYAPTWRDNKYDKSGKYQFDIPIDLEQFIRKFGNEYVLILKPHYLIADKIDIKGYKKSVRVCGIDYDIQELYCIADILITDYSSVMFDYTILGKPIIFYMYDLQEYISEIREFYFDILSEAPGKITMTQEELFRGIDNIDEDFSNYKVKYSNFCDKYNRKDKGNASKKIVDIIEKS